MTNDAGLEVKYSTKQKKRAHELLLKITQKDDIDFVRSICRQYIWMMDLLKCDIGVEIISNRKEFSNKGLSQSSIDKFEKNELSIAGVCLALSSVGKSFSGISWPFEDKLIPSGQRNDLMAGIMMLMMEVERIDRKKALKAKKIAAAKKGSAQ